MQQIGRYRIDGELGRGAMGVVYRAQDPTIGRTVAIKTIRLGDLTNPAERSWMRDRLVREAQSAGILSHPNIVTIYDIVEENDLAYIFMEFVDGPTLEKLMTSDQIPPKEQLLGILQDAAAALDYAHSKGIVHRDIKPANIMIHENGAAKITDFGVARIVSKQMTQTGTLMGTPNYMAPEQIEGHPVDGRVDQFALGVIAYELLTGEKPFAAETLPALVYRIVREEPAPAHRINPTLSPNFDVVLRKALAKKPEDRYATCTEFVAALFGAAKAKKGWKPLAPGRSQDLPTIAATAQAEAGKPLPAATRRRRLDEEDDEPVERPGSSFTKGILMGLVAGVVALFFLLGGPDRFLPLVEPIEEAAAMEPAPVPDLPAAIKPEPASAPAEAPGEAAAAPADTPAQPEPAPVEQPADLPPPPPPPPVRATAPARQPEPPQSSTLEIISQPVGALARVDNRADLECRTPCELTLEPGRHTLEVTLPGYRRALRIFEVPGERAMVLQLEEMVGTLMIKTEPAGASIYIDGRLLPEKTPASLRIPAGTRRLTLVKEGYPRIEETIEVRDRALTNYEYGWARR
ncbi:MAG: serine/threonine-protein kinase [Bryobacteraceae bacterium]